MSETRSIDLGREDELVPWSEWFRRTAASMQDILEKVPVSEEHAGAPRWVFRVTLIDGRTYAVTQVSTHISRGRCFLGDNRWDIGPTKHEVAESAGKVASVINAGSPICDVITGYTMMGNGEDGLPTVLNVPPHMIASVEGVLLPRLLPRSDKERDETEPFGFARWAAMQAKNDPQLTEVEEPAPGLAEGAD
ncbi:MAG: hypothetical protein ACF8MJ_04235 [Phycisphaerales bacterium JB050]